MESANVVINDEQSFEELPEEVIASQKDHVEDSLPTEYVRK